MVELKTAIYTNIYYESERKRKWVKLDLHRVFQKYECHSCVKLSCP